MIVLNPQVRCTASLYDLYWQTTEKGAEEEGRTADNMAADKADNEVKVPWEDYEEEYDDQNNIIIGGTSCVLYKNFPEHSFQCIGL